MAFICRQYAENGLFSCSLFFFFPLRPALYFRRISRRLILLIG